MRWPLSGFTFPVALVAAMAPGAVAGQVVAGTVIEEEGRRGLPGAFVTVWDGEGRRVAAGLAGPEGRFRLSLSRGTGEHTVRAELIGYGSSEAVVVPGGGTPAQMVTLVLTPRAIFLEGIEVAGARRCEIEPDEGTKVHELWDEARKALEIEAWTREQEVLRFHTRRWERLFRIGAERVADERLWFEEHVLPPFVSETAEVLVAEGFTRQVEGQDAFDYFAPDAEVLLSDGFLEGYCFGIRQGGRNERGLVGLTFQPVEERGVPAIAGVLWMESESGRLRYLEFQYLAHLLDPPVPWRLWPLFGGRVEFRETAGGAWAVVHWNLRMPRYRDWDALQWDAAARWLVRHGIPLFEVEGLAAADRELVARVQIKEEGGEVAAIFTDGGAQLLSAALAVVEGRVRDSTRGAPLENAVVGLRGTAARATTDSLGRFRIAQPVEGSFELLVTHPRLDTLAMDTLRVDVELVLGEVRQVEVEVSREEPPAGANTLDLAASGDVGQVFAPHPPMPGRVPTPARRASSTPAGARPIPGS